VQTTLVAHEPDPAIFSSHIGEGRNLPKEWSTASARIAESYAPDSTRTLGSADGSTGHRACTLP